MTNREYIESLSNKLFAFAVRNTLTDVGKQYNDSISGIEEWLGEEYYEDDWVWTTLHYVMSLEDTRGDMNDGV